MARKNLLKDLLSPAAGDPVSAPESAPVSATLSGAPAPAPAAPEAARPGRGAIGAVGRGIADLRARAVVDLDPALIDAGGVADRLEHDEADHARLIASLRDYGQQVPVLVRPHPGAPGRYQAVYGRRRILALRDLGQPVKALVRDLDDLGLVLAQGQENTARRDLSFIEKTNFARQMTEAGYERRIVCDALSIDKTVISRMLSIAERIPAAVIEAVGAAPGVGRDRWLAFSELFAADPQDPEDVRAMLAATAGAGPDGRFEALEAWLRKRARPASAQPRAARPTPRTETLRAADGRPLAALTRRKGTLTLTLKTGGLGGFDDWLAQNLADLHETWRRTATNGEPES